ncbi:MAG: DUF4143 domain-containing protein [Acidobacteria bacterium]|nr:DUF4143 domain-containing protein [Acidobacteriota bacterium]
MSTGARIVRAIIRGHATIASINPPGHADPEGWLRLSGRENRTPREVNIADFWFSNRTRSIVKSPKLYFADSGLLCALLNVRSEDALGESPQSAQSGRRSFSLNCGTVNAAPGASAVCSSGATEHAKWILLWT